MSPDVCSVVLVVGLFMMGVVSPGPNFFVVVERSMASGFRAGLVTGLGVATGDAVYAAAGLLGLATIIVQAGWLIGAVRMLGGLYIAWIGIRMLRQSRRAVPVRHVAPSRPAPLSYWYRVGLFTDLANPKTVVFFASIFATAYDPRLPAWIGAVMWTAIVLASVAWRAGLAAAFSRPGVRSRYTRFRSGIEALFGALLVAFGLRLVVSVRAR